MCVLYAVHLPVKNEDYLKANRVNYYEILSNSVGSIWSCCYVDTP